MLIRSSVLSEIKLCVQRAYYTYELGLVSKKAKPSVDLVFGSIIHKAIEIYHKESREVAYAFLRSCNFEETNLKNKRKAVLLLEIYIRQNGFKYIAVERNFSFKIGKHVWKGRFDGIVEYNGELYVVEYKTTNPYFLIHKPNDQLIAYWAGGRISYQNVAGVILISIDPRSLTVNRTVVSFTWDEFLEWREETKLVISYYQRCLTAKKFPKTGGACKSYGRNCPFLILCTAQEEIREKIIEEYFDVSKEHKEKSW